MCERIISKIKSMHESNVNLISIMFTELDKKFEKVLIDVQPDHLLKARLHIIQNFFH